MNRVPRTQVVIVVAGLAAALVLRGCYSRSARKTQMEEAAEAARSAPASPTVTVRRAATPATYTTPTTPTTRPVPTRAATTSSGKPAPVVRSVPSASGGKRTSLRYGRPGFAVYEDDGRLWVFEDGSEDHEGFLAKGEPAKRVTRIGVGPDGRSLMSSDGATLDAYLAATVYAYPGFHVEMNDGRLWVFQDGSEALADYRKVGEPAKRLTRIAAGPGDLTIIGPDAETLDAYMATKGCGQPGFAPYLMDGRLWVFRNPSDELVQFATVGEPAKRITRIGAGPRDLSLVGPDNETLDAYMAEAVFGRPGFATFMIDGRLWVFRDPSPELDGFREVGEPAKRITRVGQGPRELTIVGPDGETLDAYMAAYGG